MFNQLSVKVANAECTFVDFQRFNLRCRSMRVRLTEWCRANVS